MGFFGCRIEVILKGNPMPLTRWGEQVVHPRKVSADSAGGGPLIRGEESRPEEIGPLNRAFDMTTQGNYVIVVYKQITYDSDPGKWSEISSNKVTLELYDAPRDAK
jgi:hypothetical protein